MDSGVKSAPEPNPRANRNPRWVIDCRNCLASFAHSEIGEARTLNDYLSPTKPEFPLAGQEMECPSCKTKATYMRHELRYST
jgi:hypothetical protein